MPASQKALSRVWNLRGRLPRSLWAAFAKAQQKTKSLATFPSSDRPKRSPCDREGGGGRGRGFCQVDNVDIKRLPDGTSRGFAFVKFVDRESVDKAAMAAFRLFSQRAGAPD